MLQCANHQFAAVGSSENKKAELNTTKQMINQRYPLISENDQRRLYKMLAFINLLQMNTVVKI